MNETCKNKIEELLKNSREVYVTSIGEDGVPFTKAMFTTQRKGLTTHYFSTNLSSHTTARFLKNDNACLYFCQSGGNCGLTLTGKMRICTDSAHKEMLWNDGDEIYYPLGVTDSDYIVYEFTASKGVLWYQGRYEIDVNDWRD